MNAMAAIVRTVSSPFTRRAKIPPLTKRVQEVADWVRDNPGCSRQAVAAQFECAGRTAGIHLQAAKLNNLVRCEYLGRFSKWYPHVAPD